MFEARSFSRTGSSGTEVEINSISLATSYNPWCKAPVLEIKFNAVGKSADKSFHILLPLKKHSLIKIYQLHKYLYSFGIVLLYFVKEDNWKEK